MVKSRKWWGSWSSTISDGVWTFRRKGSVLWMVYPSSSDHCVAMTGADVSVQLFVPFSHKLLRVHLYHTDSAFAASNAALTVTLQRNVSTVGALSKFSDQLFTEKIVDSKHIETLGDDYKFEECVHTFVLNGTDGHKVFPIVYLESLG